jgi:hypothetical protein
MTAMTTMNCRSLPFLLATWATLLVSPPTYSQEREALNQYAYDSTVVLRICPQGPTYGIHIISFAEVPDSSESSPDLFHQVYKFVITDRGNGDTVQVVEDVSTLTVAAWTFDQAFLAGDFNFDGYSDFRYLLDQGATANPTYRFWLYDSTRGKFELNDRLGELIDPSFDSLTKKIITFEKCGGGCWTQSTYAFSADSLVIIGYLSCEYIEERNGKSYSRYTLAKTVGGKIAVVRTAIVSDEEFETRRQTLWR